jgi:hypothetical protein
LSIHPFLNPCPFLKLRFLFVIVEPLIKKQPWQVSFRGAQFRVWGVEGGVPLIFSSLAVVKGQPWQVSFRGVPFQGVGGEGGLPLLFSSLKRSSGGSHGRVSFRGAQFRMWGVRVAYRYSFHR